MSSNPYQSPQTPRASPPSVDWRALLPRVYWLAWLFGTALILLSWVDIVSPTVGWAGFVIAAVAALASYVVPSFTPRPTPEPEGAVLTAQMVAARNHGYDVAFDRFREGGTLLYEGVAFALRGEEIACATAVSVPIERLDGAQARRDAAQAQHIFQSLRQASPDFASCVADKTLRVSLVSDFGASSYELCRLVDDELEWMVAIDGNRE